MHLASLRGKGIKTLRKKVNTSKLRTVSIALLFNEREKKNFRKKSLREKRQSIFFYEKVETLRKT